MAVISSLPWAQNSTRQEGARIALDKEHVAFLALHGGGQVQNVTVHQFHRPWFVLQRNEISTEGIVALASDGHRRGLSPVVAGAQDPASPQ